MTGKPATYTENNSLKETWKNSNFKNLFPERKSLLESYPAVNKGLVLPEPSIKFGSGAYSFKTTDVVDKATFKAGTTEFIARYKKDSKKFDISIKEKYSSGTSCLYKYENRGDNQPHYVMGVDFNKFGVLGNAKFNPFTGIFKCSGIYDGDKFLQGCKIGGDLKANLPLEKTPQFNLGAVYRSAAGTTGAAFNDKGELTVNHFIRVDKYLTAGVELVQNVAGGKQPGFALAAGYKLDPTLELRGRVNQKGELNAAFKKTLSKEINVEMGTVLDVMKLPEGAFQAPSFGFKVKANM